MLTFLQLFEIRKGQLTYLKQLVPDWPDYVVKDLLYRVVENDPKYMLLNFLTISIEAMVENSGT